MLTRTTTAGPGDIYGAMYGHPMDPRTDDDSVTTARWFVIAELESLVGQMKSGMRSGGDKFDALLADVHDVSEPK